MPPGLPGTSALKILLPPGSLGVYALKVNCASSLSSRVNANVRDDRIVHVQAEIKLALVHRVHALFNARNQLLNDAIGTRL
jgi:hypothetical protein